MTDILKRYHRQSMRLPGYDYAQTGAYFVTICTVGRGCVFGDVVDDELRLNDFGETVADTWEWLATQYPHVALDRWTVMPNHLHGILVLLDDDRRSGSRTAPTDSAVPSKRKPLGRLIGAFKTASTKRVNELRRSPGTPLWQRNYYEHVIRNETSLDRIRQYIAANPARWAYDPENPGALAPEPKDAWRA